MTEQEFQVIRAEFEKLSTGLAKAIDQIVEQEAEIKALNLILERKRVVSPYELTLARADATRELHEMLQRPDPDGTEMPVYRSRSNVVSMGRFRARRCKTRI